MASGGLPNDAAQPAVAVGRAPRSPRSLVRPPLNGSIVMQRSMVSREGKLARYLTAGQSVTPLTNVAIAACVVLVPASSWAQGTETAIGAAFDDGLRRLFLFIGGGIGLVLVMIASSSRRRELLGITFLFGLVIAVAAALIARHYGSWLTTAPLDETQERFVPEFVGKLVWSIVTALIGLAGIVTSLVRLRTVARGDR
jgi:hypothetical protein